MAAASNMRSVILLAAFLSGFLTVVGQQAGSRLGSTAASSQERLANWREQIPVAQEKSSSLPVGDPAEHGLDEEEIERLRGFLRGAVESGSMPTGAALLIAHRGELIFKETAGRLEPNSILFLASSTKPITATVVAILAERGLLSLDDPLKKHIPEFNWVQLENGKRPAHPPTVGQAISNSSGISGVYTSEMRKPARTLASSARLTARRPLVSEPGRTFTYSGVAFGIAARVAEVVTRKPFEQVMREVLLEPLGMKNTRFGFPQTPDDFQPENPQEGPFIMGGGGLVSTLDDMAIFYQAHLNGGVYNGQRVFSQSTATLCRTSRVKVVGRNRPVAGGRRGSDYSLGFFLLRQNEQGEFQEFNHGGASGTLPWAEADRDLVVIVAGQDRLVKSAPLQRRIYEFLKRALP